MTPQLKKPQLSIAALARNLRDRFAEAGFTPVEPPILQPADAFIDMSGENIRRRLFVVQGAQGEELCLRPDLTIPVARIHLETTPDKTARYCYAGPSFRRVIDDEAGATFGEFYQAGFEAFGFAGAETDMEILRFAIDAVKSAGLKNLRLCLGDPDLFRALLEALEIPDFWRNRLLRHFWRKDLSDGLEQALAGSKNSIDGSPEAEAGHEAMGKALSILDQEAGAALVREVLALGGIEPVGGRSAEEIAERFMERAAMNAAPLSDRVVGVIRAFLEIDGEPEEAFAALRALFAKSHVDLEGYLTRLEAQTLSAQKAIRETDGDTGIVEFDTKFGRNLEYYSGFVFEISDPSHPELRQIAGGGRYDRLMTGLGSKKEIPATGCAIYVDRLIAATGSGS